MVIINIRVLKQMCFLCFKTSQLIIAHTNGSNNIWGVVYLFHCVLFSTFLIETCFLFIENDIPKNYGQVELHIALNK